MPEADASTAMIVASLFPPDVFTQVATEGRIVPPLLPEEGQYVRKAVPKRRNEFAAGRACARRAIRRMGIEPTALLRGSSGEPLWPDGVLGSITHCDGLVATVVCRTGAVCAIGVDAEPRLALDTQLVPLVCTDREIEWMARVPACGGVCSGKLIFSAKETVHKCLYPLLRITLDFRDVELTFFPDEGRFLVHSCLRTTPEITALTRFEGRYATTGNHLITGGVIYSPTYAGCSALQRGKQG